MEGETRALTVREESKISVDFVVARSNTVKQIMSRLMKENEHFYKVFGSTKYALGKSGSEKLLSGFRLGVDPVIEDLSIPGIVRYRVMTKIFDQATGQHIGTGVGECSSGEEKYKWRGSLCDEEFDITPEDMKRVKFKKGKNGTTYKVKQIRTEPADQANTILKMAKKRSQIDGTLTATGASDVFTQDEDWTGFNDGAESKPDMQPPQSKSESADKITQPQMKKIQAMFKEINPDLDSDAKRKMASTLADRELSSMTELSKADAKKLIDGLQDMKMMKCEGEAPF